MLSMELLQLAVTVPFARACCLIQWIDKLQEKLNAYAAQLMHMLAVDYFILAHHILNAMANSKTLQQTVVI